MKVIETFDGLEVQLKVGKESEFIVKGDFIDMMKAITVIMKKDSDHGRNTRKIEELKEEIKNLQSKIETC